MPKKAHDIRHVTRRAGNDLRPQTACSTNLRLRPPQSGMCDISDGKWSGSHTTCLLDSSAHFYSQVHLHSSDSSFGPRTLWNGTSNLPMSHGSSSQAIFHSRVHKRRTHHSLRLRRAVANTLLVR